MRCTATHRWGYALLVVVTPLLPACATLHRPAVESARPVPPVAVQQPKPLTFLATAYSQSGTTAAGTHTHEGIVAADPAVLPLGSVIHVLGAGAYSGEYVVKDTVRRIDGHEIDIYLANAEEAKRFGKRRVRVEVVSYGKGR